jgi:hypothetical protein
MRPLGQLALGMNSSLDGQTALSSQAASIMSAKRKRIAPLYSEVRFRTRSHFSVEARWMHARCRDCTLETRNRVTEEVTINAEALLPAATECAEPRTGTMFMWLRSAPTARDLRAM